MHKYFICILFGIILFILLNNNEGFNIGCPGVGEPCDDNIFEERCKEHLACVDGTCRSAAGGGAGGGGSCAAQLEDRCPSLIEDEVYRTILRKKKPNANLWDKRCFILFRDRIEYYKGEVKKGETIFFNSINSTEIIPEGNFNYLNITTNTRTYVLWAGETRLFSSIEELPTLEKFKNKLMHEQMRNSLFTYVSLEEEQLEVIQYYDLYTLCVSITFSVMDDMRRQVQFSDRSVIHQNIIDKLTPKILDKGFSIEPIPHLDIDISEFHSLTYWPVLLKITRVTSGEVIYLLNLMPGVPTTTINFYIAAKRVKELLLSNLYLPIDKLIIVGHSSGAALLLLLVINLVEGDTEGRLSESIRSIMCITSGLGLCDTFIVDAFESIIEEKSEYITYYDIINMSGLPKDDDCWLDYFLDNGLIYITIISEYCLRDLCKQKFLQPIESEGIDLSIIPNEEEILAHLEDTSERIIEHREYFPQNYTSYKDIIIENLHDYYSSCISNVSPDSRTIYDCKDLLRLFYKHINNNTFAILPGPHGGLFSYDKNTFLYSVLLEGPWTRDYKVYPVPTELRPFFDPIIRYSEGVLCFSDTREPIKPSNYNEETDTPPQSEWTPEYGAHTLKLYNVRLQDLL